MYIQRVYFQSYTPTEINNTFTHTEINVLQLHTFLNNNIEDRDDFHFQCHVPECTPKLISIFDHTERIHYSAYNKLNKQDMYRVDKYIQQPN